jgi:hypothetical protein
VSEQRVSESGGTMTLLSGSIESESVDLSVLEPMRVVPRGFGVRPSGVAPYFEPGQVLSWEYAGWVDMMRVVRDDERGLVAWLPSGSERRIMIGEDGGGLRDRPVAERSRVRLRPDVRTWTGHGILRIAPTGRPWSIWYFTDEDGRFAGHYVNLELTHERPADGTPRVFSRDLILDLWMDAEGIWLKDADELEAAVAAGRFTPEQGAAVEAIGRLARTDLLQPGAWPLDEDWESWCPPTQWDEPLSLPPDLRPPRMPSA